MYIMAKGSEDTTRSVKTLRLEKKQFELLADSANIPYDYMGFIVPANSMTKMNRWKIWGLSSDQMVCLKACFDFIIADELY